MPSLVGSSSFEEAFMDMITYILAMIAFIAIMWSHTYS